MNSYFFKNGLMNLVAYWLGCVVTRCSRTGYLLLLGGILVSWKRKKQYVVSRYSVEADYRDMVTKVSEVHWLC